ncbi:TlpA family protein disulfide reductase [Tianweitania sp. BSSL-BM11]|uniref:TlpA family protein disulfide reductase n=1 Tax=Tianweitania aestuarii TaxID=2814886 RepID=A0ABS5S1H2_9HYPH|nr:TlpA disulfide reductase family protein [Tianweitania aestuarii]MBS9722387.1 TlpA family protein disulfide reductase [Tianweitania aestuarii]
MTERTKLFPAKRWIAIAALAGAMAGAVAVYVNGGETGKFAAASGSPEDRVCAAKADKAQRVGEAAIGEVAAMLPADPPQSLASLAFNDPAGQPMTIADLKNKTVLLNLWATWCAPCREEMPALDALEKEVGDDGFEVVAVNIDTGDDTKPKAFLADTGVTALAHYRDNSLGIFNELKSRALALGLPVTLLIDEDGCLLTHMNGPAEWNSEDARRLIAEARKN